MFSVLLFIGIRLAGASDMSVRVTAAGGDEGVMRQTQTPVMTSRARSPAARGIGLCQT